MDPDRVTDVRDLLILMDLLWQQNLRFGMKKSGVEMGLCFPRWHRFMSYFDIDILPSTDTIDLPQDGNLHASDILDTYATIELPSLAALKHSDGNVFCKIWEHGSTYRTALSRWRAERTERSREVFIQALETYSKIICAAVPRGATLEKFAIASPEMGYLAGIFSTILAPCAAWVLKDVANLSDTHSEIVGAASAAAPLLLLMSLALLNRKVKINIGYDQMAIKSCHKEILLS
jgi:hypothetical protein